MVPVVLPPGCRLRYVRAVEGALQSAHAALMQALSILERVEGEAEWQAIARGLERCFVALYDANDARREPLPSLTDAMAEAAAARAVLGDRLDGSRATLAAGLDQARAALGRAHDEATQQPAGSGPADRPLRASEELPRLHTVARASLAPNIRVVGPPTPSAEAYEPLPSPTTFEELETWGARSAEHVKAHLDKVLGGPADTESTPVAPEPPSGPQRFVRTWARDCFEEIAMLGVQRRPLLDDDWRTSMELEQRMLWSLDAFVSLGSGALRSVEDLVLDAPPKSAAMDHVSLDRFTSGPMDGHLFREQPLWKPDHPWEIKIVITDPGEVPDPDVRWAFAEALADLATGRLQLGAGSGRGHGWMDGSGRVIWSNEREWTQVRGRQ